MTESGNSDSTGAGHKKATFAAGCFWSVEAAFRKIDGVLSTSVGYIGGSTPNATYKQVCTGDTGHAEAVQVVFDPDRVTYDDLLESFWDVHDPTTKNRQGPDVGSQYRSAIYFHDDDQRESALASRDALQQAGRFSGDIVTEITAAGPFYLAEDYHQQYLEKRGESSCSI